MSIKKSAYYSFDRILSRNAVFNLVMGARGLGKTYGAKKFVIRKALERGEQFIYLRRYNSEMKTTKQFFADVAEEFPGYSFRVNGRIAQMQVAGDEGWQDIGFFVALSTSQQVKSTAYPRVTTIIFDEFIIDKGAVRYLPNEVKAFQEFYSTVDRWKDKTRVLMLANAVSVTNPYFIEWRIDGVNEFESRGNGFICAHFADSLAFENEVSKTRFGAFLIGNDPEYAAYAVQNQFSDARTDFVAGKPSEAVHLFNLRTDLGRFSVWRHGGVFYLDKKIPNNDSKNYTICDDPMEGEERLTWHGQRASWISILRTAYNRGEVYYKTLQMRNAFREIFK